MMLKQAYTKQALQVVRGGGWYKSQRRTASQRTSDVVGRVAEERFM